MNKSGLSYSRSNCWEIALNVFLNGIANSRVKRVLAGFHPYNNLTKNSEKDE